MQNIEPILSKPELSRDDIVRLLSADDDASMDLLRQKASGILLENCGPEVYFRGLIEFSNICLNDCDYCGIRRGNTKVKRFQLTKDEIVSTALWCAEHGYGSVVLQSGERRDPEFVDFVEDCVGKIKQCSRSERLPNGLGITLCVGEQTEETYRRFLAAGAHRYLLRIETSSPRLYARIHPESQRIETRIERLRMLNKIGFQVGTGVMIGLPGQAAEDLADDILFFRNMDIDMIGMGPFIPHSDTPLGQTAIAGGYDKDAVFRLALRMIAVTRLVLKDVNIASTTALQAIHPEGRELGLQYGANVIMPMATPPNVRHDYLLYEGKPCLDESAEQCSSCLRRRIESIGRTVALNRWGDSRHFSRLK